MFNLIKYRMIGHDNFSLILSHITRVQKKVTFVRYTEATKPPPQCLFLFLLIVLGDNACVQKPLHSNPILSVLGLNPTADK